MIPLRAEGSYYFDWEELNFADHLARDNRVVVINGVSQTYRSN